MNLILYYTIRTSVIYVEDYNRLNGENQTVNNVNYKKGVVVMIVESRLTGLKKHAEEINAIVKESLQGALIALMRQKTYERITVTELCVKAGVSRTAFYGNFKTKDDILKDIVLDVNKVLVSVDGGTFRRDTTLQWYEKFFSVIKEKADILKLLIDAGFHAEYLDIVNEIVLSDPNIPVSKKYQRLIWTGGVENAIVYWLNGGMRESVEEMAKFCDENLAAWSY